MIFILIPFIHAIAVLFAADDNMGWRGSEIVGDSLSVPICFGLRDA
jgi:hypothetical protein